MIIPSPPYKKNENMPAYQESMKTPLRRLRPHRMTSSTQDCFRAVYSVKVLD